MLGALNPLLFYDGHQITCISSSLTGFSFKIPDSEMTVIEVDGGNPIIADETNPANSIGILYPAERVDLILGWPEAVVDTDTEITIQLDKEYVHIFPLPLLSS
jgi:hypothetical protein